MTHANCLRCCCNSFTWVGYFLLGGQLAVLVFILLAFDEPARLPRRKPTPLAPCGCDRHLPRCDCSQRDLGAGLSTEL